MFDDDSCVQIKQYAVQVFCNSFFRFFCPDPQQRSKYMINSQLIDLLQHFSPDELREFRAFVASPYFNRGAFVKETSALLAFIEKAQPDFLENSLDRKVAYATVFSKGIFVEGKLDKVMSELHLLSKDFVAVHQYMQPENEFQQLLDRLAFYRTRGLENRFENLKQRLVKHQHDTAYQDQAFFHRAFLLEYEIHKYQNLHNHKRGDLNIPVALESLDVHYFFLKTELLSHYLLQQKVTQLDLPPEMIQTIRESKLPDRYMDAYPVLRISHKIFRLLEEGNPAVQDFEDVHELLNHYEAEIEPALLRFYFTYIRNLCVLLYNGGHAHLLPMLFILQKDHLARGYLYYDYYDNKISPSAFLSLCSTAFKLKEYDWAKTFITDHRGRIIGDNDTYDYCQLLQANYWFAVGEYDRALDILPPTFQDLDYHLYARRLELKIYYESGSDLLPYKMDAFKMHLSRASQKILAPTMKEMTGNFINLLFQLYSVPKGDTARAQRIIQRIKAKQSLAERDWLLEKAEQLL